MKRLNKNYKGYRNSGFKMKNMTRLNSIYCDKDVKQTESGYSYLNNKEKLFSEEIILKAIENNILLIKYFDKKYMTNKIYLAAFDKDPSVIIHFPKDRAELFKEDIIIKAVESDPLIIKYIPKEYITPTVAFITFCKNPYCIEYFPNDKVDLFIDDFILNTIKKSPSIIKHIPEKYITNKIYLTAFDKDPHSILYFPKDRAELFKEDILLKAIEYDDNLMECIPKKYITTKIALIAFDKNSDNIIYFPKNNPDLFKEDIILKAIENNPFTIMTIPKEYITNKLQDVSDKKCKETYCNFYEIMKKRK